MPDQNGRPRITEDFERACAAEPIHIIGTVQPHGFVLVVDIDSCRIVQVSSGAARHWAGLPDASSLLENRVQDRVDGFGTDPSMLLAGLPLVDPIPLSLQPRVAARARPFTPERPVEPFECVGHRVGSVAVLEWQGGGDAADARPGDTSFLTGITSALANLRRAQSLEVFFEDCVREVARLCGFDRVMLYRFLPDWSGEVMAEETSDRVQPRFLGLRFPASDIPPQARTLYTHSKLRILADVQAVPDTLMPPRLPDGAALDQSQSLLRGFSDVHRTYLTNMGARASMSLSIVCDGTLWGLIACHHEQPRIARYRVRQALRAVCELVAGVIATRVQTLEQLAAVRDTAALDRLLVRFQQDILRDANVRSVLDGLLPELLAAFQASALCVRIGDLDYVGGPGHCAASESQVLDELAALFGERAPDGALQLTDVLRPGGAPLKSLPEAAGLLAVRLPGDTPALLALTRTELVQEVEWAGAPGQGDAGGHGAVRLEPRRSFDLWRETVRGTARAWSSPEVEAGARLLDILGDAHERHAHQAFERETQRLAELQYLTGLQRANAMLEVRVAERTAQLEALNKTLIQDSARSAIAADAAGVGFWNFDIADHTMQWDDRMYRLYGSVPLEGDDCYELWAASLHSEDRQRCEHELADAIDGNRSYDTEFRIVHPDGTIRHLRAAGRVVRDADGHAGRMFGANVDITERKHADELFRLALEAAPAGMLLTDLSGTIVLVNAQIEKLFGYFRAELLGRPVEVLLPERFRGKHPALRNGFNAASSARAMGAGTTLFGLCKDGTEVPLEVELNPVYTSEGRFVLGSVLDLSQRREMEQLRSDFVSTVSHELRTPLTSIGGSLGLLHSGALGVFPEKARVMLRIAYENSGRLERIINEILDIGRLESGKLALKMTAVPLSQLLRQSVEANAGYAQKCEVRLILEAGPAEDRVMVDPDRFLQVMSNLLSNAAKFSPPGSEVLLRVRTAGTALRVEVEDSGPGIPEAFKERIFEKFAQADSSASRRFAGTGLGLSIAKKLIEAMGGTIGFTSTAGRGTIFHVELPRLDVPASAPLTGRRPKAAAPSNAAGRFNGAAPSNALPRLLHVEGDEDLINVIRATLADRAHIVSAHSLKAAERVLRKGRIDLVILDRYLPDGNGFDLIDQIPVWLGRSVPVVILAGADVPRALHRKVAGALVKSQVSAGRIATTILSYLPRPHSETPSTGPPTAS